MIKVHDFRNMTRSYVGRLFFSYDAILGKSLKRGKDIEIPQWNRKIYKINDYHSYSIFAIDDKRFGKITLCKCNQKFFKSADEI